MSSPQRHVGKRCTVDSDSNTQGDIFPDSIPDSNGTRARLWDFSKFIPKVDWTATMASACLSSFLLVTHWQLVAFLWSAERFIFGLYISPPQKFDSFYCTPFPRFSHSTNLCRNLSFHPSGNQTDELAMVFLFTLRTAPVTLPIPISTTCTIACTFTSHVFQDTQALKSSEWAFVPVEFEILYHYLQTRKFLWILDLTKR